ncbi:unnamed protein product [Trichobilharzia szidati]|nr:unnamed protein product [Trichobilharzia szidati]
MRCFLLFITSFILLHVQQSTQDDLKTTMMKRTLIQSKLQINAENLKKNNATLTNLTKALQERIGNINNKLSPDGLSIDEYVACIRNLMEAETGVGLMESLIEAIESEKKNFGFTNSYIAKMKQCFQIKIKKYEGMAESYAWEICSLIQPEVFHQEIEEITNLMGELYAEIKTQAETVFQRKLYTDQMNWSN